MSDLYVLDTAFKKIAIIDAYESLIWTERFNSYGEFELYLIPSIELLETLAINNYLKKSDSDTVMIISTRELMTDIEDGDHLTVRGKSLESLLERRIVWTQTTFQGTAVKDAIQRLISDSITSPSVSERKISNFVYDGPESGIIYENDQVTIQFTGDNLYDAIQTICEIANISFKVILEDGNFRFKLFSGKDRSYAQDILPRVLFNETMENLISTNYYNSVENYMNVTLVAGAGEGTERKTYTIGTTAGIDRRELYTDARDISDQDDDGQAIDPLIYNYLLSVRGNQKLIENQITEAYESSMETKTQYEFNKDYKIGDVVELVNKYGIQAQTVVSEVVESYDNDGYSIVPTFITKDATIQSGIPGGGGSGEIDADAMIMAGNNIYKPFVLTTISPEYQQSGYTFVSTASSGYVEFIIRRRRTWQEMHQNYIYDEEKLLMPKIIYRTRDPIDVSKYSKLHVIYELSNKVWKTVNTEYGSGYPTTEIDYLLENVDDTQTETISLYDAPIRVVTVNPGDMVLYGTSSGRSSGINIGTGWGSSVITPISGGSSVIGGSQYEYGNKIDYQSVNAGGGSTIIGFVSEYSTDVDKYTTGNSFNVTGYEYSTAGSGTKKDPWERVSNQKTVRIYNNTYAWGAKEVLRDYTRVVYENHEYDVVASGTMNGFDGGSYTAKRATAEIGISSTEKQYIKIGVASLAGKYSKTVTLPETYIVRDGQQTQVKDRWATTQAADPHKPVYSGSGKKYAGSGYAKYDLINGKSNNYFPNEMYIETRLRIYGMYLT